MTNRKQQIEDFLNRLYISSKKEVNDISGDEVYERLIFNNITSDKMCDQSELFPYWQEHYKKSFHTKCFVSPTWTYFCQFINENKDASKSYGKDPIKIYVSLDRDHIYSGAKQIFNFLDVENICHRSKIGRKTRVDNIVMRIYNKEDAEKIINFINSNKYLIEGHNEVSPFNFKCGIVGLVIDNFNSYNRVLSEFIASYINKIKNRFPPRKPRLEDFYKFLNQFKVDNNFIWRIKGEENIKNTDIIYINEIKELILKSLITDDLRVYIDHYDNVVGNTNTKLKINTLSANEQIIYDTIKFVMIATEEKYDKAQAIFALKSYINESDPTGITRQDKNGKEVRETICKINPNVVKKFILEYTSSNDISGALEIIYNEIHKKDNVRH